LLFTGRGDAFLHLPQFFLEGFKEAIADKPPQETLFREERKFAIPIGLGCEANLQLLRGPFFPKKNWRRLGKWSLVLFTASLCLSALLLFAGMGRVRERLSNLSQALLP